MQATCSLGGPQARVAARQRRGQAFGKAAPRSKVVAAVASVPKSSSPLLEGLVAEGIITAEEAASCTPEQLEFLIRKRFNPESSPEPGNPPSAASIQAYVADGIITQEEAEKCSPAQLEFLIRKRSPQAAAAAGGAANVVPFPSPSKDKSQPAGPNSVADAPNGINGRTNGTASSGGKPAGGVQAYIADGILTPEEVEKCSPQQLEFLIRKRSPSPPARGATQEARAQPARRSSSPRAPPARRSTSPRAAAAPAVPQKEEEEEEFVQLSLEEYLARGIVTEYEIEKCSPHQLEFLIRKRLTMAKASAAPAPSQPQRGRSRGPARPPPVAAVQARAASASAPPATEEEAPRKLVVPRAPPLTDDSSTQRSPSPAARMMAAAAAARKEDPRNDGAAMPWAGVAAAGLTMVGLSAGLYFAGREGVPAPAEPAAMENRASAKVDAAKLADKPAVAAKVETPAPPKPAPKAVPPPPPPPAAKVESKAEPPAIAPKAEEKKTPPPPPAAAAVKDEPKPASPAAPKEEKKDFLHWGSPSPAATPAPTTPPPTAEKAEPKPVVPPAPKEEKKDFLHWGSPAPAPAPAPSAPVKAEEKQSSKELAAKLAADLAAELENKQQPAAAAKAPSRQLSASQTAVGGTLAAAGVVLAGLLVPGAREAILSRFAGEAAVLKSASAKTASLQKLVDAQQGDLRILQDQLSVAQAEYGQALAKLNSAKGALDSLANRVLSSEKAAKALVADLERLPSKEAQRLKQEAATIAASVATQRMAVEKALQRAFKDI